MVTWDGYDYYYYGLTSLTLTNYPILRTFSFTRGNIYDGDYVWDQFEFLIIHDLPSLETIRIGEGTIPNCGLLNIYSMNKSFE